MQKSIMFKRKSLPASRHSMASLSYHTRVQTLPLTSDDRGLNRSPRTYARYCWSRPSISAETWTQTAGWNHRESRRQPCTPGYSIETSWGKTWHREENEKKTEENGRKRKKTWRKRKKTWRKAHPHQCRLVVKVIAVHCFALKDSVKINERTVQINERTVRINETQREKQREKQWRSHQEAAHNSFINLSQAQAFRNPWLLIQNPPC